MKCMIDARHGAAMLIALSFAMPPTAIATATPPDAELRQLRENHRFAVISMSTEKRVATERRIANRLEGIINTFWRERGGIGGFRVKARFGENGDELIVDPGRSFIFADDRGVTQRRRQVLAVPQYDERQQWLENAAYTAIEREGLSGAVTRVRFLFDGKDYYFYFPDERPAPRSRIPAPANDTLTPAVTAGPVVISAGHGLYAYHGMLTGAVDWVTQREEVNGVVEDYVTPLFANDLRSQFQQRSPSVSVVFARSESSAIHSPSGHPWWKVAARGHLESILPDNPEIWRSRGNEKPGPQFEYHQDIRSRPRYANFLGATGLISLHTNGDSDTSVSGTRLYVAPERTEDFQMAQNMLCQMKQVVNSIPAYASFRVDSTPRTANHGENTAAQMPAVVVEAAFHTNPSDALAIQDPAFRTAIAKGIERGFRRHKEGRVCARRVQLRIATGLM